MNSLLETGNRLSRQLQHGALIEYTLADLPLMLFFAFNPQKITRTRTTTMNSGEAPGTRSGYDFQGPMEIVRASQGVTVKPETLSITILLDATDRLNAGDPQAQIFGIQTEIDTLFSMVEPKIQTPQGGRILAALGAGQMKACNRQEYASVLLFRWSVHLLPVFMTEARVEIQEYLPSMVPYRAEATLALQIISSDNPFYRSEMWRQFALARQYLTTLLNVGAIGF